MSSVLYIAKSDKMAIIIVIAVVAH